MPILGTIASQVPGKIASGSFEYIASATGNNSSATMVFSSIPSTYKHLQIRFSLGSTGPSGAAVYGGWVRLNGDTGNNYSFHGVYGDSSSAAGFGEANATHAASLAYATASATNVRGVGIVDILEYADANKYKTIRSLVGGDFGTGGNIVLYSGSWRNTNVVSSITLSVNTGFGNFYFSSGSKASLYGIKGQ